MASIVKIFFAFLQPLLVLGKQLGIKSVSLISSCSHSIKKFRQTAVGMEMPLGRILHITDQSKVIGDVVKKFLDESVSIDSVGFEVMLPSARSFIVLVFTVSHYVFRPTWPSSYV
jgi:hypothetical protein